MTAYFIGCNNVQGIEDEGATIATSTQSKDVEIQINGANVTDKLTAVILVQKLLIMLVTGNGTSGSQGTWPPV